MERLTPRNFRYCDSDFMDSGMAEAMNKLAHYEDLEEQGYKMVNIDKIVAQLEEMEEKALRVHNYDVSFYATGQMHKAIEIVKAGGTDG
jgi:hypothetical protein